MTPNWVRAAALSRHYDMPAAPRWSAARAEAGSARRDEVLVIEDDVDIAGMYALGLSMGGHPSRLATSKGSVLDDASRDRPVAIVLDLGLRYRNGLEVLDSLRHDTATADVPVIVLSFEVDDFAEAYRLGATECHSKQRTTPRQLLEYVEGAIRAAG